MIRAGIIGSTGYAGQELVRILLGHKDVEIKWYGSRSYIDQAYASVFQNMFQLVPDICKGEDLEQLCEEVDVVFTATPQGLCSSLVSENVLSKVKIIDLSADFRIKDVDTYEKWYGIKHQSPQFIEEAVYGLCEVNRDKIKNARLIANPGCYPTCSFLSIYPLAKAGLIDMKSVIVDAKSGTSGAGRGAKVANLYCEVNESIKAYGVATHRHTPEIEEQLSYASGQEAVINFTPHLVPMNRGILVTAYANLVKDVTEEELLAKVRELNEDADVDGFIVQLPLPKHISEQKVIETIDYRKDVDGFHPINVGRMSIGLPCYVSATPNGILELLKRYQIETSGKKCVVLGRSNIVGKPMAALMMQKAYPGDATVTVCHSRSKDLVKECQEADIIIAALGQPNFVKAEMVKEGAVVIDVGTTRVPDSTKKSGFKLTGDVKFDEVAPKCSFITPVPGGVGPMTIVSLMKNTLLAGKKAIYQ